MAVVVRYAKRIVGQASAIWRLESCLARFYLLTRVIQFIDSNHCVCWLESRSLFTQVIRLVRAA